MPAAEAPRDLEGNLFAEAERQLRICNACRYCEGYCSVFASLERRPLLTNGDITHLAHLCHDCRNCFYACMYSPPHSLAVNPPRLFSELRRATYDGEPDSFARRVRVALRGWRGALAGGVLAALVLMGMALLSGGTRSLVGPHTTAGSPYGVIPYEAILIVVLIPCAWSVFTMSRMGVRYWTEIQGSVTSRISYTSLYRTVAYAIGLRYLKGAGAGCAYPDGEMSQTRRRLHAAISYGFVALLLSTMSAGISQHVFGVSPPYPIVSVPVGLGIAGGASMVLGCTGLIILKARADPTLSDAEMIRRDCTLLIALDLLVITGLLTLALRDTSAFGIVFVTHLAMVVTAFAIAPYTKIMHAIYRFLSVLKDNMERAANDV